MYLCEPFYHLLQLLQGFSFAQHFSIVQHQNVCFLYTLDTFEETAVCFQGVNHFILKIKVKKTRCYAFCSTDLLMVYGSVCIITIDLPCFQLRAAVLFCCKSLFVNCLSVSGVYCIQCSCAWVPVCVHERVHVLRIVSPDKIFSCTNTLIESLLCVLWFNIDCTNQPQTTGFLTSSQTNQPKNQSSTQLNHV